MISIDSKSIWPNTTSIHDKNSANQEEKESFSFWYIFDKTYICLHQMYKLDLEKIGTRDQIANICWITENAREFQENICFTDYVKAFGLCGPQRPMENS